MTEPRAVVIAGTAGSGKTTCATALARHLHFALFDLDQVVGPLTTAALELVGRDEAALDGFGRALRTGRYASLATAAAANLAVGLSTVLVAPFSEEIADASRWEALVESLPHASRVDLFVMITPPELVLERLVRRDAARDRDKIARRSPPEPVSPAVPHVTVPGDLPLAQQLALIERALVEGPATTSDESAQMYNNGVDQEKNVRC